MWHKTDKISWADTPGIEIDETDGVIKNIVMAQAGVVKGHGYHIEESFVEALVNYDLKHHANGGLKARFSHPSMSNEAMGKQLGRFTNFRYEDGKAIADLKLLDAAEKSPTNPGMKSWVLSMAQEDPGFIMSSIVFTAPSFYQYDPERPTERVNIQSQYEPRYRSERIYAQFDEEKGSRHLYTDLVEAGAATDALFSAQMNPDAFAVRVTEWFRENNDVLDFLRAHPEKIAQMCDTLDVPIAAPTHQPKTLLQKLAALIGAESSEKAPELATEIVGEFGDVEANLNEEIQSLKEQLDHAQQEKAALQATLSDTEAALTTAQAEVQRLCTELAAGTTYEEIESTSTSTKSQYLCPTTRRALGNS